MGSEPSDATEGEDQDASRIPPELRDDASDGVLSDHEMNERAEFAFVDRIDVGDNEDLVEVTFELPFGEETFTRTYERGDSEVAYTHPPLSEVFEAAGVERGDFDALLTESVPVESDGEYSLGTTGPADRPEGTETDEATEAEAADWLPDGIALYPEKQVDERARWRRRGVGLATLAGTAVLYELFGWIPAGVVLVVGLVAYLAMSPDEFAVPEGARELTSDETLAAGDVVVLDKSLLTSADDRDVVRVTDVHPVGMSVELPSGLTATLRYADSTWYLEGAITEQSYDRAYELPV